MQPPRDAGQTKDTGQKPPLSPVTLGARLATIGGVIVIATGAFAYAGGWLTPQRLTPGRIVTALSDRGGDPVGHRRNHSKGVCFTGTFQANGRGAPFSTAPMLAEGHYPVTGRFAIAVGDPAAADIMGRVKSMAIRITAGGQEWRSGMNNSPVFVVSNPRDFYALTLTQDINPATGKPNPEATKHFFATHPASQPFARWAATAPWTASFADESYNSLNAFRFIDAQGHSHLVRWSMQATIPPTPVPQAALAAMGPDYLEKDLAHRLVQGPLAWHMIITLAGPGDPSKDATQAWPENRQHIDVGTLTVTATEPESNGPCRDINYDPTILPSGITVSDDPLLPARSAAYARSYDLRTAEADAYPRTMTGGRP